MVCARISNTDTKIVAPFSVSMRWLIIELHCNLTRKEIMQWFYTFDLFENLLRHIWWCLVFLSDYNVYWYTQLKRPFLVPLFWDSSPIYICKLLWKKTVLGVWLQHRIDCPLIFDAQRIWTRCITMNLSLQAVWI